MLHAFICILLFFFLCSCVSFAFVTAVVTMSEFLELPNWDGTDVVDGPPLPEDQNRPVRTVEPLPEGQNIPPKEPLMKVAEKANDDVVKAREKKERENREKAAAKRKAGEGTSQAAPRKKTRGVNSAGVIPSLGVTVDTNPLNVAPPNSAPLHEPNHEEHHAQDEDHVSQPRFVAEEEPRNSEPHASDGKYLYC